MNTSTPYRCQRPIRIRKGRFKNVNCLIRSITQINETVQKQSIDMANSTRKLRTAKFHLQRHIEEVRELELDLEESNIEFNNATQNLRLAIDDMKNPQLYTFEDLKQTVLNVHLTMAEQDIIIATKEIKDIEKELKTDSPVVKLPGPWSATTRCFEEVIIPKMDPKGISSLIAAFNEDPKCTICLENKCDCVLYQCGHMCLCFSCAIRLTENQETRKCPLCRSYIKKVIKTNSC